MEKPLKQEYKNTFRMTDARSVVKYDTLLKLLDNAGFTDDVCKTEMDKVKAFTAAAMTKIKDMKNRNEKPDVEAILSQAPQPDADKVTVFQTTFLQEVKDELSMILLTTM